MRYTGSRFALVVGLAACGDAKVPTILDVQDVNVTTTEDTPINVIMPVSTNRPLVKVSIKTMPAHGTIAACATTSAAVPCSGASADDILTG